MTYVGDGEASATLLAVAGQPHLEVGTTKAVVVASPAQTGGRYSLYRLELAPRARGAAPHFHRHFSESFLVLRGEALLYDGRGWQPGSVGDHLLVPEGGVHGFSNESDAPAELLMLNTPGVSREDYFYELGEVASRGVPLSDEEWRDLFSRHDLYMV